MSNTFDRPSLEVARDQIKTLLATFEKATGLSTTFVGKLARGEPKFPRIYQNIDFGFRSYDIVNSRLSAIWPKGTPWPEGVPRQAPAEMSQDLINEFEGRLARYAPKLPEGAAWPADIPKPG